MHLVALYFIVVLLLWLSRWSKSLWTPRRLPLPPGPVRKWFVGNLLEMPAHSAWLVYTEWRKRYDIFSLQALGTSIVVINTIETVTDLLDKRSAIYSDRPVLTLAGEMMGMDHSTSFMKYGRTWREHRKLTNVALSREAVKKYVPVQEHIAVLYLRALLEKPEDFIAQLRLTAGRIIMAVTYGLPVNTADEDYITVAESALELINRTTIPGTYMVDLIPALKYIPDGFPLAEFKQVGLEGRRRILSMITGPFEHVKREMAEGKASPSFTSHLLELIETDHKHVDEEAEEIIKWAAGTMYGAGGETTHATVLTFILAMALFPETQAKAQAEIDRVTRSERLPGIQDRPDLPYVSALIKETMRWHVALPLSIARRTTQDDIYKGYHIPAGSLVVPNIWAIAYDETNYKSPHDFVPERFLDVSGRDTLDPYTYAFGFGRRMCTGRHLASNSLYILISYVLATFHISRKVDAYGNEIPLTPKFTTGLVSYPEAFECRIVPRSSKASEIVMDRLSMSEAPN